MVSTKMFDLSGRVAVVSGGNGSIGRFGRPGEFAGTAVYLASQASDFVIGTTLFVDGGYAIR